ncbi:hypothetical protein AMC78_PB00011 (plasmid) [Rhizobium phaseoli]|nr:hypothetical protein AMC78_PB00011 [Rhizobium phaseoli]
MAPAVLRDGLLKTHLIFDVNYVWHIADPESEFFASAVHTIAHECGHVEVHTALDQALPGRILRHRYADYIEQYREEVIDACFQEYGATRLSAGFGLNPIDGYRQTFLTALADTDAAANGFISAYRTHGDIDRVLLEVPPLYANLIKWASYLIGTMHGLGIMVSDQQGLADALSDHWFADYFARLEAAYAELWERLGQWESASEFDGLGDIAIEVLEAGGMFLSRNEEDGIRVDIPFRANNTPNYGLLSLLRGI